MPEEDLASEPPLLPPDTDAMLTADEARNIIGGQVRLQRVQAISWQHGAGHMQFIQTITTVSFVTVLCSKIGLARCSLQGRAFQ